MKHIPPLPTPLLRPIHADCLDASRWLAAESMDLVYMDPPFNSGRDYSDKAGSFTDKWDSDEAYLDFIGERLLALKRVMKKTASIWVHCDDSAVFDLKPVMDEVFGRAAFKTCIAWKRSVSHNSVTRGWGRVADHLLHYAPEGATFHTQFTPLDPDHVKRSYRYDDDDGRGAYALSPIHSPKRGGLMEPWRGHTPPRNGWCYSRENMQALDDKGLLVYPPNSGSNIKRKLYLADSKGKPVGNLWSDIPQASGKEKLGYPTQKPLALLERIISASSNPGDFVLDPFMGSGTTLVAARRLGRHGFGFDVSADAVAVTKERLDD